MEKHCRTLCARWSGPGKIQPSPSDIAKAQKLAPVNPEPDQDVIIVDDDSNPLAGAFERQRQKVNEKFSQEAYDQALAEFIAEDDQPFTIAESRRFRRLIDLAAKSGGSIRHVSDTTAQKHVMKHGKQALENVKKLLQTHKGRIHVSLDAWTSPNQIAFAAVVAHRIDDRWNMHEQAIDFFEMKGVHSGARMAKELMETFKTFQIVPKIGCIVADNAYNMDTLVETLSDYFYLELDDTPFPASARRIRCHAHIVHLGALEILKIIGGRKYSGTNSTPYQDSAADPSGIQDDE